ncbi:hypothetical protein DZF93_19405, partial [Clavibacter michiganensis subsp. insidiosus]
MREDGRADAPVAPVWHWLTCAAHYGVPAAWGGAARRERGAPYADPGGGTPIPAPSPPSSRAPVAPSPPRSPHAHVPSPRPRPGGRRPARRRHPHHLHRGDRDRPLRRAGRAL